MAWQRPYSEALAALGVPPVALRVDGEPGGLPSRLAVGDTAVACVATALTAAARLRPGPPVTVGLDAGQVAAAVRSEAHLRVDGRSFGTGFDPLSRFWRAADGWVRTHANYPWHREALARALDAAAAADAEAIGAAIAGRSAEQVEAQVVDAGGVAAAVRTPEQWRAHPQAASINR